MKPSRADKSRWNQREWLAVPSGPGIVCDPTRFSNGSESSMGVVRAYQGTKRGRGLTI
jgi:hypothetical protein